MRFIAIGLAAALLAGQAAAQGAYTVGVLMPHRDDPNYAAFPKALRELGYQEGRNLTLMLRSADRKLDRLPTLAAELLKARANVILAINTPGARAAILATKDVPIVMAIVGDPLGSGFVSNLGRPGGNVTGISNMTGALAAKRMSLMKELVPGTKRIAALYNPVDPVTAPQIRDSEQAAPQLGIEVRFFPVKTVQELPDVFAKMLAWGANAAFWLSGQGNIFQPGTAELSVRHRLPVMVNQRVDVEAGGLISYIPDNAELYRRAAVYVDRILKGAKPGDLPVEQPTKFELSLNLKTASAMGLAVPSSLLLQADHVVR
ncbi:MAG: ABC transporter substrate-binding protein [Betaproteobacteria bacterium]